MITSVLIKLDQFKTYSSNWCYGEGEVFSQKTIGNATGIAMELLKNGFGVLDAFPGLIGNIRVTAYRGLNYLEFTVEDNGLVTFLYESNDVEIEYAEDLSLNDCVKLIKKYQHLCNSYESSTKIISISKNSDFKVWHSTPQGMEASPYLVYNAHWIQAKPSATTYATSMRKSAETLPCFGLSTVQFCPNIL